MKGGVINVMLFFHRGCNPYAMENNILKTLHL
jgi:hypothetical protein